VPVSMVVCHVMVIDTLVDHDHPSSTPLTNWTCRQGKNSLLRLADTPGTISRSAANCYSSPSTVTIAFSCSRFLMSMTFQHSIFSGGTFIHTGDNDASASISKGPFNGRLLLLVTNNLMLDLGFEILHGRIAPDAFHDSGDRFDPPKCHPNTRLAVLDDIMRWVQDLAQSKDLLWLYGPAGAGKSAIAQTIAEMCVKLNLLVASFFFFRSSSSRNNEKRLMASIAYQLALSIPETRPFIGSAVHLDPSIFDKSLETQVETLIIGPLEKARSNTTPAMTDKWPRLIIIDGLDECDGNSIQRSIIDSLSIALLRHRVPLILFFASRPEPHIRSAFNAFNSSHHIVLDDSYDPDTDIQTFLSSRFKEIKENHPLAACIPESWPPAEIIARLVQKSSGQFVYASTVVKYLDSSRHNPMKRLDVIIQLIPVSGDAPYKQLDTLYTHIFSCVEDITGALEIIGFLIFHRVINWNDPSPQFLADLFGLDLEDVYLCLSELHSILDIPPPSTNSKPIKIFHASLNDFLVDKLRSGDYYLDDTSVHTAISQRCLLPVSILTDKPQSHLNYERYSHLNFAYHCSRASTNSTSLRAKLMQSNFYGWFRHASSFTDFNLDLPLFFEWLEKVRSLVRFRSVSLINN
jgi:NACHT domain